MDDPNDSVSARPGHGTRLRGCRSQAAAPFFYPTRRWEAIQQMHVPLVGFHAADNRNTRHAQDVLDFGFFEPRRVIVELQPIFLFIQAKSLEAVSIRKERQLAQLLLAERRLQFIRHGHESHARIIAERTNGSAGQAPSTLKRRARILASFARIYFPLGLSWTCK